MRNAQYSPNIAVMIRAAEKASRGLVRDFGEVEQLQVSRKGPADFVSAADIRAEKIIFEELEKARPGYGFLMEEQGKRAPKDGHDSIWVIDPLDGTTNFLHGLPHWAVSIALEVKGEVTCGVIYDPVKDELFWAEKGRGAYMNNRRLRVSGRGEMSDAVIALGTPAIGKEEDEYAAFLEQLDAVVRRTASTRRMGAASLDLAYVAAGRFDGFWETGLSPWDVAAGALIIKEAGGFISDMDGKTGYIYGGSVVAGNGQLQRKLLELVASPKKKKASA
ncbi:MAG: inositol monophosphatase [Alphaproteobacteria bacterium]|nr:MAG: inositol monophosphatase [Alphaproteobacteria bacterium]